MILKSLPFLPAELLAALEACGIRTSNEFLFPWTTVELYQKLPEKLVTVRELELLRVRVAALLAAPGISGDNALQLAPPEGPHPITTGLEGLDDILVDFSSAEVFEISGAKGSGKTVRHRVNISTRLVQHL